MEEYKYFKIEDFACQETGENEISVGCNSIFRSIESGL